jgi:medium-chain acyl-[acyl-carrier-protein] hydrolase
MRLICFPYAGGGASIYRRLPQLLPDFDVRAIELPGRGGRWRESAHDSMDRLVESLLHELTDCFDVPFGFLGHSMGAAISFELACRLPAPARENLRHLFLSARGAPGAPQTMRSLHTLDDSAFKQELRRLNGTPSSVLDSDELMEMMMPMLRADFTLIERYRPPVNCCIPVDLTVFAGSRDHAVPVASVAAWKKATSVNFHFHLIEGDHFFLSEALPSIAAVISARLRSARRR